MVEPIIGRQTNEGAVRDMNEDSLGTPEDLRIEANLIQARGTLVAVADGMGGHAAGEIASQLAIQELFNTFYGALQTNPEAALKSAYEVANNKIFTVASNNPTQAKMGTTLASALLKDNRLYVANVGDSRVHLIRGNQIKQLTSDHSWVAEQVKLGVLTPEQARQHQFKNVITRAVGTNEQIEVDILRGQPVQPGDFLVLCSDGLSNLVPPDEMLRIVNAASTPQAASDQLISIALGRKADDNITAIVVRVPGEKKFPVYWIGIPIVIGVILLAAGVSMFFLNPAAAPTSIVASPPPTQVTAIPSAVAVSNSPTAVAVINPLATDTPGTQLPSVAGSPTAPLTTLDIQNTPTLTPTETPTTQSVVQGGTAIVQFTATPLASRTPTATATSALIYSAPVLRDPPDNAILSRNTILLWSFPQPLKADEVFDVLVWREGETKQESIGNVPTNEFGIEFGTWRYGNVSGRYLWTIRVIRKGGGFLSPFSPPRSFNITERATPEPRDAEPPSQPPQEATNPPPPTAAPNPTNEPP